MKKCLISEPNNSFIDVYKCLFCLSHLRSTQDLALKKDFKRGAEFTSRSSRPEAFPEVTRGREVIVRRETLPTPSSSIDTRQVKERSVHTETKTQRSHRRRYRSSTSNVSIHFMRTVTNVRPPQRTAASARFEDPSPSPTEAPGTVTRVTARVLSLPDPAHPVSIANRINWRLKRFACAQNLAVVCAKFVPS